MNRAALAHLLRAAAAITDDPEVLVIGSQSVLGALPESALPTEAILSIEADLTFLDDPDEKKSDLVDGAIGELSPFHETFGYYAQGVGVATATLPRGWRDRLIEFATPATAPGRGWCLEPHDCVIAKLVAGREKDFSFAGALLRARLIDPAVLAERIDELDGVDPAVTQRLREWLAFATRDRR